MNVTRVRTFLQPFFDFDFAPFFEGKGFARESGGGGGGGGVQCKLDETWVSPYPPHFVSI